MLLLYTLLTLLQFQLLGLKVCQFSILITLPLAELRDYSQEFWARSPVFFKHMFFWCPFLDSHLITYLRITEAQCCLEELPHNLHDLISSTLFRERITSTSTIDISNCLLLTDVAIIRSFNCRCLDYCYVWSRTVYLNSCVDLFRWRKINY